MNFNGRIQRLTHRRGFTRGDLVVVIALVVVVGGVFANTLMFPSLRSRPDTLVCQANLGQIGRGYQLWAADHGDRNPFLVSSNEGGLRGVYLANNSWYQFAWISNQLGSPKVLVCPADTNTTRVAKDFSRRPDGGFLNANYQNNAISYFIGMHAQFYPRSILGGDRNISGGTPSSGCSYAMLGALTSLEGRSGSLATWRSDIHAQKGHLLFNDGAVEEVNTIGLRASLLVPETDFGSIHVLFPK